MTFAAMLLWAAQAGGVCQWQHPTSSSSRKHVLNKLVAYGSLLRGYHWGPGDVKDVERLIALDGARQVPEQEVLGLIAA
jgi:hypothetical protein